MRKGWNCLECILDGIGNFEPVKDQNNKVVSPYLHNPTSAQKKFIKSTTPGLLWAIQKRGDIGTVNVIITDQIEEIHGDSKERDEFILYLAGWHLVLSALTLGPDEIYVPRADFDFQSLKQSYHETRQHFREHGYKVIPFFERLDDVGYFFKKMQHKWEKRKKKSLGLTGIQQHQAESMIMFA